MSRAPLVPPPGQRCIIIDDLRLRFFIGVHDFEKRQRQEVSISVCMFVEDGGARRTSDDLADHVSYADIIDKLKRRAAEETHINLVEMLAEEVASFALADPRVVSALVDVRKTEIIPEARGVGVIIRRERRAAGAAEADHGG
jgi:7,8-dihydroneopterin aldolase/epimerase/oxygenase